MCDDRQDRLSTALSTFPFRPCSVQVHRGIAIHSTDCGTWMWASDDHEAADMAATLDEARRQVDALLGPEVAP